MKIIKFGPVFFILLTVSLGKLGHAQTINPQSINSGGNSLAQVNGTLSFTVGELVVFGLIDIQGNTLGGGFTSGATLSTLSIQEIDVSNLDVNVFPNPTQNLINIQINQLSYDELFVTITDLLGKDVYYGKYAGIPNIIRINTASYTSGTYILSLKNQNNQVLSTFKVTKN